MYVYNGFFLSDTIHLIQKKKKKSIRSTSSRDQLIGSMVSILGPN
jgi:hypothetical protein